MHKPSLNSTPQSNDKLPASPVVSSSKTTSTPVAKSTAFPICEGAKLAPSDYQYVVESVRHRGQKFSVSANQLRLVVC